MRAKKSFGGESDGSRLPGLAPRVDPMIAKCRQVRLLIDVSGLNGWESYAAFFCPGL